MRRRAFAQVFRPMIVGVGGVLDDKIERGLCEKKAAHAAVRRADTVVSQIEDG